MKLEKSSLEPSRICRQADATEKAVAQMIDVLNGVKRNIEKVENDLKILTEKHINSDKLRFTILEKNEMHRMTIEKREKEVGIITKNMENEKARLHDNITKKVELNLYKKEVDADYRHRNDLLNFLKKDYDAAKRLYKKKRGFSDVIRQMIPTLESQQLDEQHNIKIYQSDRDDNRRRNEKLKDEIDITIAHFLEQEGLEKEKKEVSLLNSSLYK